LKNGVQNEEPNAQDTRNTEEDEWDMRRREIKPKSSGEAE